MIRFIHKTSIAYLLLLCLALSSSNLIAQITTFAPNPITAGTTTVLTITGTGFGTGGPNATMYVEFKNADDGGATYIQPIASEYVSWSTTQILVRVPSDAGTGTFRVRNGVSTYTSATSLTIPYDLMNVVSGGIAYRTDHINKQAGGYVWQMTPAFDAASAGAPKASFIRSLETWRCATFINWQLGTPTAPDAIAADGINVVRFDKVGQELPPGVLGRCTSRWTSCSSGGTWEWWVYELDIEFDQATAWQYGPAAPAFAQYDFESVSLHELGHGHQLGHVNEPIADVMNYSISNGATRRTLTAGNVNGGLDVMAKSTAANLCTPAPMVALNSATCLLSCPSSPVNDAICSATLAPVDGTCVTSQTNVCSTGDITGGCMTSAKTVWYKYVVTAPNNQISITFPTSTFGGSIETALYSGLCGSPVFVGSQCGLPSDTYRFTGLTPGTYTFGVSSVAGLEGNFSICAIQSIDPCVAPPANDAICSPVVLTPGSCVTAQNNCPATADYNLGCAVSNKTLWYSITLTGANDQLSISFANTAAGFGPNVDLQLYSGACGTPVAVDAKCGTKTTTFTFTGLSAAGSPYRLGVSTDAAYTGLFDICATQSINPCTGNNPANDAICSARTLPVDATCLTSQTNVCATADYTSGCATSTNTVWYQFNLTGINSVMNVSFNNVTFGGGGNVQIMLASGLCTTPTFVSTYCGLSSEPIRFTNLSTLTTYYLSVSTTDGNQGTFDICGSQSIDCGVSTPANDDICSAIVAPVNGSCLSGQTNVCATPDVSGGCVTATAASVYYSLTVTAPNNALRFTFPTNSFGGLVQTYLFAGPCTTYTGVNSMCATAASTFTYTNLAPGTYFLMVATETNQTGNFTICVTQYQTPPGVLTGPMQDCAGAIPMCAATYNESNSYIGFGNQELAGGTCLGTNESNSVWYSFSPQSTGSFAFTLSTLNDYDFAVYDITSYTCADIPSLVPIRCNWSGTPGNTGLTLPSAPKLPALSQGGAGVPTNAGIDVLAGERYVIIVDNYSADNNGYTLSFTGTAQIFDNTPPTMTGVSSCSTNQITLQFNEDISCDSLDANEFRLIDPITGTDYSSSILSVSGLGCGPGLYTNQVIITHNGSFPTSTYQLITNKGKIQDKCGNRVPVGTIFTFDYLQDILVTSNVSAICTSGQPVVITANGGNIGATYTLNPGGLTNSTNVLDVHGNVVATTGVFTVTPFTTTQYTVSTTSSGCTKTKNLTITLVNNVVAVVDPVNVSICAGTTTINASATVNGLPCVGCSFQWSGGSSATTPSITVGAGTYNVVATTPQGCPGTNTASSTVAIATAGVSPSCNVYYVSPTGGGDGLTKGAPTTLQNALTQALCQTAIIKMQTGIYTLTDKINVNSFVTIEGGYDATFTTKTSNMTGGTNSTTIRRSNTFDSDNSLTCTAFSVVGGANGFLFQDLRIELPGSTNIAAHPSNSQITNYGIKIGAACTGYNIVRCFIDAGTGSN